MTEPFTSRRIANLRTEIKVSGCTGPSWPSSPARALRWSSSACRVGCGWMTAGWHPMPWRDGPCAVIRNWWKAMCWWRSVAHWLFEHQNLQIWESDLHRMGWWEARSQGEGFSCIAWIWHTLSMHQPKLYMHSHFLQNNVDLPCHKMHVLLLRSNNPV